MEDLERIMEKFSLSSIEQEKVSLEDIDVKSCREECKLSLIGKVFGEKMANILGIKSFANNMWNYPKNLKVIELGNNLF